MLQWSILAGSIPSLILYSTQFFILMIGYPHFLYFGISLINASCTVNVIHVTPIWFSIGLNSRITRGPYYIFAWHLLGFKKNLLWIATSEFSLLCDVLMKLLSSSLSPWHSLHNVIPTSKLPIKQSKKLCACIVVFFSEGVYPPMFSPLPEFTYWLEQ